VLYQSVKKDEPLIHQLTELSVSYPKEGFWKCYYRLRNQGELVNHKRLHRIYKLLKLPQRRKGKKRLPKRVAQALVVPPTFTHTWSIDFMSDALSNGRKIRTFNVIDDYNREILYIDIDYSLKSNRILWVLQHLSKRYGKPQKIRMDNGPEFIANIACWWSEANAVEFMYIEPGKPTQNAFIERFNRTYRENILDAYLVDSIDELQTITDEWVKDYNEYRPHDALGGLSPKQYKHKNSAVPGLRYASATPPLHFAQEQHIQLIST
jgi:putative transposase